MTSHHPPPLPPPTTPRQAELQALSLKHTFAFRTDLTDTVHNLSDARRNALFFVSGHIGVIYDADTHTQTQLLGHSNAISCCVVSADRAYIVTADAGAQHADADADAGAGAGEESLVIIWNALTATPIRTLPLRAGACALDLSADASLLAITTTAQLYIYHWATTTTDAPLAQHAIPCADAQTCVRFHPADPLLISNGQVTVIFWHLFPALFPYIPPLASNDFRHPMSNFTQSTFLPSLTAPSPLSPSEPRAASLRTSAASATMDGDVVVWDVPAFDASVAGVDWGVKAIKALQLHQGPISVLTCSSDHIVTGGAEGFVRFFDSQFRILAWFEDLGAGAITSLSFSRVPPDPYDPSEFKDADFIVATKSALVVQVQPASWEDTNIEKRRGRVMLQFHDGNVFGVAAHPAQALFATTGHFGQLQLWDYDAQALRASRRFDKLMGHRLAFDPLGQFIAVGFTNGTVRVVYADDLRDVAHSAHRQSRDCITEVIFSPDGQYLATSDSDRCVVLYKLISDDDGGSWAYIGKYRAHTRPITNVIFGVGENDYPRLLSISEDRTLVEFDLATSSPVNGLVLKNITKIEQVAVPTSMTWHPRIRKEDFLIVASDQYKFKLYNSNTKTCRKTVLGPTYGGPVNRLVNIPSVSPSPSITPSNSYSSPASSIPSRSTPSHSTPDNNRYLAYGTHEKIIGLIKLPLDGNPHRTMGLIAHPGEVASLCASYDAQYLFSAGGADGTVFMWRIDARALDALADAGGAGVTPYAQALERERGGEVKDFWTEMYEYFYFAQLKSQGEDTMRPRHIGPTVLLSQVPHILRGLGYYPTEREVDDLTNELKFTNSVDTGEQTEEVTLETIIKAYMNHKPVFAVNERDVEEAFEVLGAREEDGKLNLDHLLLQLQSKGEAMSEREIDECMRALLGEGEASKSKLEQMKELTAREFAEVILGFDPTRNGNL